MPSILNMFILAEARKRNQDSAKAGEDNEDPEIEDGQETDEDMDDDSSDDSGNTDDEDDLFKNVDAETGEGESDDITTDDTTTDDDSGLGDNDTPADDDSGLGDDNASDDTADDNTDLDDGDNTDGSESDDDGTSDMDGDDSSDEYSDGEEDSTDEETQKLKNKKLLNDYFKLYTDVGDIIDSISNVDEHNKFEFSILIEAIRNLEKLRYTINDYINIKFVKSSYEENLATYYKMTNSIKITDKIISNIIENRNKN